MIKNIILTIISFALTAANSNFFEEDLIFLYQSIVDNHPAFYNEEDYFFKKNLEKSYTIAKEEMKNTKDEKVSKIIIDNFIKSFQDPHLQVVWFDQINRIKSPKEKFSIKDLSEKGSWITLSSFSLNKEEKDKFQLFLSRLPLLRNKDYIILDLRGNQGGNSIYCEEIINYLFGKDFAESKRAILYKNSFTDWRASPGNLEYIASLVTRYPEISEIAEGIKLSLTKGEKFYRDFYKATSYNKVSSAINSHFFVIIDSSNVSSTLVFLDQLKAMTKKLLLIGEKTKADRIYSDVRSIKLPSQKGNLILPMKILPNRPRKDQEGYLPDLFVTNLEDDIALEEFLLQLIKKY
jgi:hypothetical protein